MTELQLCKFINDNDIEYRWDNKKLTIFVDFHMLMNFTNLIGIHYFYENPIECYLRQAYLCIEMNDICEKSDIKLENIFKKG
jgi:hypothetical protein